MDNNMNNINNTNKIKVSRQIFNEKSDRHFTWKDIKHLNLEDNDILNFYFVDEHEFEDGYHKGQICRFVEETDEEYKARMDKVENWKKKLKQNRYQTYLELKKEFENIDTTII
jgi:hypothetical protein